MTVYSADFIAHFWARVDRSGACWRSTGSHTPTGHGNLNVGYDPETGAAQYDYAHRVAWELTYGPIPPGQQVVRLPVCPFADCVRPAHHTLSRTSYPPRDTLDDLWGWIDASAGPDGCWRWRPSTTEQRVQVTVGDQRHYLHRLLYEHAHNLTLAQHEHLYARCGHSWCLNPAHWVRPSRTQSLADQGVRVPRSRGEHHHAARLTEAQVRAIKWRLQAGEPKRSLAREYGVSFPTIFHIAAGRTWKHVTDDVDS